MAGAAVSVLDEVQSDSTGRAVTRTTGLALGKALTAAANAGDIIEVELYGAPSTGADESSDATGAAVADAGAIGAAGGEPTAADLTATQALRTTLNALLASLRASGQIAP